MAFPMFAHSKSIVFGSMACFLFLFFEKTAGQNLTFPVNILEGLQNGQITVDHSPLDIGAIENAFDGNFDNLARSANVNPMVVTLTFGYTFNITATSFTNNSESTLWTVEAAQSLADLNAKTGSYQKLVAAAPHSGFATSTKNVAGSGKILRLTMQKQCCDNFNHLEEWGITATANIAVSSICMKPNQVRLIPNASFQPNFYGTDASGNEWPISSGLVFSSSNSSVVAVNGSGLFSANSNLGETNITATWNGLTLQKPVKVVSDFKSTNAEKRVIKVAMVVIDPPIPAAGGQRFSEKFWAGNGGPAALAQQVRDSIFSVSGGTVEIQIVETHQESDLSLNRFGGNQISVDSMYKLFLEPGWPTLHLVAEQTPGGSVFQYNDLLNKYNFCEKSNAKQIDEIWVWAMPFIGMYESNMAGTDAFWINGPVISGNSCTDLISIMGFNYERYAGCALHNYTHRTELTMAKVYNTYYHYSPTDPPYPPGAKDPYQLFQNYDALQGEAGQAHVGNGHFPANGTSDYDYDNLNFVPSRAPNWKRYPLLFDQTKQVNCADWGCEGDCGLNFCSYWLRHLPHFKCKDKYGRLNNWWTYIFDYNEGKAMESQISDCDCQMFADDPPQFCASKGNFPWEDWISSVKIGAQEKTSGKSQYSDFTSTVFNLPKNTPTTVSFTTSYSYFTFDEYWRVWIDFSDDGTFLGGGEEVFSQILTKPANGTASKTLTGSINIPSGVPLGPHRMRVAMKRGAFPGPCEAFAFGEVEDFIVNIQSTTAQPCTMTAVVSSPTCSGTTASATVLVTATGGGTQGWIGSYSTPGGVSFVTGVYGVPAAVGIYKNLTANSVPFNIFDPAVSGCATVAAIECPSGPAAYCPSKGNFPWEDWISRMQFKDVDNSSGKSQYSDFTGKTVNVNAGFPVNLTLGAGFSYFTFDEYWKVWIDYDQNGIFDEATETFLSLTVPKPPNGTPFFEANASAFVKGGFTQEFTTRMRVAMKRGSYPTPCETFAFGEVEDYSIHIAPGGGQSKPDLSLLNFLAAGSGAQGAVVPYTFDLKNSGTANATGNFTIGAYLSTDGLLSANDVQVGTVPTGNTPIGTISNVAGAITVPANLAAGAYFLILKADIDNTIAEIDELNNSTSRPFTVTAGPGGGGADLEITLTADKTTAPIYSNVNYILTAKNNGNQPISSAKITVGVCAVNLSLGFSGATGLVYASTPAPPTAGTFNLVAQEWTLANLAPGQAATLTIPLFTLTAAERKVTGFASAQSPADPDSQAGAKPANCTPAQDDEAVWTINAGQMVDNPDNRGLQNEAAEVPDFQIYPNPAGEQVFVDLKKWAGRTANLSMFNQLGVLVFQKKLDKIGLEPETLDLSETMNGAYFLKIETAGQRPFYGKLIVSRLY